MLGNSLAILTPAIHHYNSILIIGPFMKKEEPTVSVIEINEDG
jgi:hypothetical protein